MKPIIEDSVKFVLKILIDEGYDPEYVPENRNRKGCPVVSFSISENSEQICAIEFSDEMYHELSGMKKSEREEYLTELTSTAIENCKYEAKLERDTVDIQNAYEDNAIDIMAVYPIFNEFDGDIRKLDNVIYRMGGNYVITYSIKIGNKLMQISDEVFDTILPVSTEAQLYEIATANLKDWMKKIAVFEMEKDTGIYVISIDDPVQVSSVLTSTRALNVIAHNLKTEMFYILPSFQNHLLISTKNLNEIANLAQMFMGYHSYVSKVSENIAQRNYLGNMYRYSKEKGVLEYLE